MSDLKKELTLSGLTAIAIGSCIGSGIFTTPANIVSDLPHHGLALLVWVIGGIVAFLGALTFSELSARFPNAGGVYVYLKEGIHPMAGFLYGWAILFIINTGALAALGFALADYMTFFFEMSGTQKKVFASAVVIGLTAINLFGVDISQYFAKTFTGLKLFALACIILIGLYFLPQNSTEINMFSASTVPKHLSSTFLLAFVGVFWSFGGWHHATYLSAETKDAPRTVPRAMLIGTLIVTLVYVLVNLAFMALLPLPEMAASGKVAGDAIAQVMGGGGKLVAIVICISIFGTIGIYTMTAPRIYYAMAKDDLFFKQLAKLHPTYNTPANAMIFQAIWAVVLIVAWGSFYRIITFVTFMDIVFMCLAAITLFILRAKSTEKKPSFMVPMYPLVPIIYIVITFAFVVNTFFSLKVESWAGVAIVLIGFPVFYFFNKARNR